jgi:hypothetical protein
MFQAVAGAGPGVLAIGVTLTSFSLSSSGTTANQTTGSTTATGSGGTGPYTYAWSIAAQDIGTCSANSPSSATTTFSITGLPAATTSNPSAQLIVTDTIAPFASATFGIPNLTFTRS